MNDLWKMIIRNTIIIMIVVFIITGIIFWIHESQNSLYKTVIENRSKWDITLLQNGMNNENYIGCLYEQDYNINNLPDDIFTALLINAYISHDNTFFEDQNLVDYSLYSVETSKEKLENIIQNTFGSNLNFNIQEGSYGCGKEIEKNGNNYIISSYDPEACGLFTNSEKRYISFISDYYKDGNDIIVKLKVGFIEATGNEKDEEGIWSYNLYGDKTEEKLIQQNYDVSCFYSSNNELCYAKLPTYRIVLKKNNGKYYFNSISKIN